MGVTHNSTDDQLTVYQNGKKNASCDQGRMKDPRLILAGQTFFGLTVSDRDRQDKKCLGQNAVKDLYTQRQKK